MITGNLLKTIWWRQQYDRPHKTKTSSSFSELLVFHLYCKAIKSLSDFSHNVVRYDLLRFLVSEYGFSVMERDLHNCFYVKGNGAEQFIPCLLQCRRLYLWDNGGNLLFCNFLRYLSHFCPVLFCSASMSVVRSPSAQIAVII